jgi:hypothetical protein
MTARVLGIVGGLPLIVKHLDVIKHVDHSPTATPRGPSKAMWQLHKWGGRANGPK